MVLLTVLVVTTVDMFTTSYLLHATEDFLVSWRGQAHSGERCGCRYLRETRPGGRLQVQESVKPHFFVGAPCLPIRF